jgi:hypothetical protein
MWPKSINLGTNYLCVKGIQVCSIKGPGHIIMKLSHAYFIIFGSYVRELHIRVFFGIDHSNTLDDGSKATDYHEVITRVFYHIGELCS